jgi:hypothetical protein
MRFTADEATQDVGMAVTGITGINEQIRFINPSAELEGLFPYCDGGWAENPTVCPDSPAAPASGSDAAAVLAALAGVGLLASRRRSA